MSVLRGYGTRRLREYNDCNLPAGSGDGGRFGANDDPRCKGGGKYAERTKNKGRKDEGEGNHADFDWGAAMRQRAIHGAELGPEAQLGDPSTHLADTAGMQQLYDAMAATSSGKAKRNVANEVGDRWKDRLSEDETLAADAFDKWYAEHASEIRQHAASVGMDGNGGNADGEYESPEDVPGYGAPDPDDSDTKSEYESYEEDERQKADDEAYSSAREDFGNAFDDAQEVARDAIAHGLLLHAQHAADVFDRSLNPTLPLGPGQEFDLKGGELTPEILAEVITRHQLFAKDDFDDALEEPRRPSDKFDAEETMKAIFDPNEEDERYHAAREELMQYAPMSAMRELASQGGKASDITDANAPWAEDMDAAQQEFWRGIGSDYIHAKDSIVDAGDAWDRWWDENSSNVYDNTSYDYMSYESWYKDKYDIEPSEWEDMVSKVSDLENKQNGDGDDDYVADDGEQRESSKYQRWAASWLLSQWASTSGDGSPVPLSLQAAAEQEFDLGKTFTGQFTYRSGSTAEVKQMVEKHGPVLRHFLRAMYDNTQEMLSEIPGDYITLYRGFTANRGTRQEPGIASVDTKNGSIVGIRMQPMSSFSVRFNTSYDSFGEDFMVARVPKSQIIGSAVSGYGCLNEYEVVVLGGANSSTVKSFFVNKSAWAQGAQAGLRSYSDSGNDMFLRTGPSADKREGYLLKQAQKRMDDYLRIQGRQQPVLPMSGDRS